MTQKPISEIVEEFANLTGCDYFGDNAIECNWLRTTLEADRKATQEAERERIKGMAILFNPQKFPELANKPYVPLDALSNNQPHHGETG